MGTTDDDIHRLGKLTDEECWKLLCHEAFSERNREKFEAFKDISEGIAKKCNGLPLAAKVLGSLLRSKSSLDDWKNVLNSDLWQLEKAELELFPHLLLTYNELSPMHKRCFSYCAVMPKDSVILVVDLIGKWMALGYLGSDACDMELKGRECFEFLMMRSLFQDFKKGDLDGQIMSCKMHDIVHDFAQYLRKSGVEAAGLNSTICGACDPSIISIVNEYCSFSFKGSNPPQDLCGCLNRLRVLTLQGFPKGMDNLIHLRWLNLEGNNLSCEDLKITFQLYNLQNLFLRKCKLKQIPNEIGCLIRLRRLDLGCNEHIKELPESICSLKELRTLDIDNCILLIRLPDGMPRLINLKHCQNYFTPNLVQFPQGLGQLTGLHTLRELLVGGNGLSKLGLLKNLNLLSGRIKLIIRLTDDYLDEAVNDAQEAELRRKIHIQQIIIEFEDRRTKKQALPTLLLGILDALEPQPNLKRLVITSYKGSKLPSWIASPLNHLKIISIRFCRYMPSLPPLGKLQSLEEIRILEMNALQYVGREFLGITTTTGGEGDMDIQSASNPIVAFPKLKKLSFHDCPNWKEWEDITAEEEESAHFMPCLTHLTLTYCTKLTVLPHRLLRKVSSLGELDLSHSEKLQQRYGDKDSSVGKSIFQNPHLQIKW